MEVMCVIPKDLRVKQEIILGRSLKEVGIIGGLMISGFSLTMILTKGNIPTAAIVLAICALISFVLTQPISGKQSVFGYCVIIQYYLQSQKRYLTGPLAVHEERVEIEGG